MTNNTDEFKRLNTIYDIISTIDNIEACDNIDLESLIIVLSQIDQELELSDNSKLSKSILISIKSTLEKEYDNISNKLSNDVHQDYFDSENSNNNSNNNLYAYFPNLTVTDQKYESE